jgi:protein SCO1/2
MVMNQEVKLKAALTSALFVGLGVIGGLVITLGSFWVGTQVRAKQAINRIELNPATPAVGFSLEGDRIYNLREFRGRIVLLYFGTSHCRRDCDSMLRKLSEILDSLNEKADSVQVIMVTLDSERDTPEQVMGYCQSYDHRIIGLSGEPGDIRNIADSYGVPHTRVKVQGGVDQYEIVHQPFVIMIDSAGMWRANYSEEETSTILKADIRRLINATASQW